METDQLRILLIAPYYDSTARGESWSTFKWVEGISALCRTTVLTWHGAEWDPTLSHNEAARVINWTEPQMPGMRGRLAWELNPGYPLFYLRARRWIRQSLQSGERFDLVHQISPLALRYPTPVQGLNMRYIVGPLAGSLPSPVGFATVAREKLWFRKLRVFDPLRLRYDPWLRSTYLGADAVIGVAPYVRDLLQHCPPRRFECMAETGVESIARSPKLPPPPDRPVRLLFVGRIIRTKGILEAIRAVGIAFLESRIDICFDVIGTGDLLEPCRQEAERLGVSERIRFHGQMSREEVFTWYARSDIFLFPSFREPSGNVVFEALSQGLPVITSTIGGPGHVVDETCGIRVAPTDPDNYAEQLAQCIAALAGDPARVAALSAGALRRMAGAQWPCKIKQMIELYRDLVEA